MKTSKLISTISYNTDEFLKAKLNELKDKNIIDFWAYIEHYAEADEKKKHKHLLVAPTGTMDTSTLVLNLEEQDENNVKPLGIMPCRVSKFADWYLYGIHDKNYLASKGQAREHHYTKEDIKTSDSDYLNELVHTIDLTKYKMFDVLQNALNDGVLFSELVATGKIPLHMCFIYQRAYQLMFENYVSRNNRQNHEPEPINM